MNAWLPTLRLAPLLFFLRFWRPSHARKTLEDSLNPSLFVFPPQVIAVGPGKADDDGKATPPSLTVGSTVLYSKYAGTELKNPRVEEEYVVIAAGDVLATVA